MVAVFGRRAAFLPDGARAVQHVGAQAAEPIRTTRRHAVHARQEEQPNRAFAFVDLRSSGRYRFNRKLMFLVQLLRSLRTLRQACCHPQVVRGQFIPIRKRFVPFYFYSEVLRVGYRMLI